jgi:hypothetical protein
MKNGDISSAKGAASAVLGVLKEQRWDRALSGSNKILLVI